MHRLLALASSGVSAAALLLIAGGALAQGQAAPPDPAPTDDDLAVRFSLAIGASGLSMDQVVVQTGPASAARGAPDTVGVLESIGPVFDSARRPGVFAARDGAVPEGIEPLDRTIYSSDDFYADRDLWMDPRYYQCGSPSAIEGIWGAYEVISVGDNPPATVPWGYCDRDVDRETLVSPYPFDTAQEHYQALLAEAEARGGPTVHTGATLPDWNGVYAPAGFQQPIGNSSWYGGGAIQVPTYLSLLTPEYQERFVQQMYHYGHDNALQWPGAYCWPEGFTRRFVDGFDKWVMLSPELPQFWSAASETVMTQVNIGREFNMDGSVPNLSGDVRQWFGDTIGFWDGDILITWTSNITGWYSHGWHEFSDQMQSIEIYSPITDMEGNFVGLNHEIVLYDPEAFVEPIRKVENWEWARELNASAPFGWRECVQTLFPVDGLQTPVTPGQTIQFTVPDMTGRPWADIWEEYFEQDMEPPEEDDVLSNF